MDLTRRSFLAVAAAAPIAGRMSQGPGGEAITTRSFTRAGIEVPILGLGTAPLGTLGDDKEEAAVAVIRRAFDLGVRYFDTAPSYDKHRAERRIGKALAGRRDQVLLATKSYVAAKAGAMAELEQSLEVLGTDHVDVFQVHAVGDDEDRKRKLDPDGGTLAAAVQAKKDGKCRFIGVTGHAHPEVLAQCLDDFAFDTMLVPVNCADPLWRSFVEGVLPKAKAKGTSVVAMKVFAAGKLIGRDGGPTAEQCLRWALSQDVAVAVPGCTTIAHVETDAAVVRPFVAMGREEQQAVTAAVGAHPGKTLEWYKKEKAATKQAGK
ncbi:MAG: aldo/keto reductase [Planctomycetes bacterium]|nr:aldo/keto reductase [Planctomycetota bacterium]